MTKLNKPIVFVALKPNGSNKRDNDESWGVSLLLFTKTLLLPFAIVEPMNKSRQLIVGSLLFFCYYLTKYLFNLDWLKLYCTAYNVKIQAVLPIE